jgi:hypothetical protein
VESTDLVGEEDPGGIGALEAVVVDPGVAREVQVRRGGREVESDGGEEEVEGMMIQDQDGAGEAEVCRNQEGGGVEGVAVVCSDGGGSRSRSRSPAMELRLGAALAQQGLCAIARNVVRIMKKIRICFKP